MAPWRFEITDDAEHDIERLDPPVARRVRERLEWFIVHFEETVPLPLGAGYKGFFKLRVGDWRIIYEVKDPEREIVVHAIDRRDKIYKRRIFPG